MAAAGFTLLELMVTLSVLAILVALAVPSFTSLINSNRLAAQANEVVASLQLARTEAIRQNSRAVVCRTTNGTSCAGANGQWARWITYVDTDRNKAISAGEIVRDSTAANAVRISSDVNTITFFADGIARTGGLTSALQGASIVVCIPTTKPAENRRMVQLTSGSRVGTSAINGGGTCP